MKNFITTFFGVLIGCWVFDATFLFAQTKTEVGVAAQSMEVRRIALADLNSILREADANSKVRELLDVHRKKFQSEFRKVETELQQTERDLMSKRELLAREEYDKLIEAFQAKVTRLQQDIQKKRQSIDNAYQKAQSDIRSEAVSVITEIATEMQLELVLNRDATLLFLPHLNISDEVLKRLNERTKNARIEIEMQAPKSQ